MTLLPIKREMTSEEKLLRLIRKKRPEKNSAEQLAGKIAMPASSAQLERRKSPLQRDVFKILHTGSAILMVISLVLALFIVADLALHQRKTTVTRDDGDLKAGEGKGGEEEFAVPPVKSFEEYDVIQKEQDVFVLPGERAGSSVSPVVENTVINPAPQDLIKNFRLVGIVLDRNPVAIIEDIMNNSTQFLTQGAKVGEAVIEKIQEGRVILLHGDQRIEMVP
jgi:hypothetical protein